jgi:hypothetical protein
VKRSVVAAVSADNAASSSSGGTRQALTRPADSGAGSGGAAEHCGRAHHALVEIAQRELHGDQRKGNTDDEQIEAVEQHTEAGQKPHTPLKRGEARRVAGDRIRGTLGDHSAQ